MLDILSKVRTILSKEGRHVLSFLELLSLVLINDPFQALQEWESVTVETTMADVLLPKAAVAYLAAWGYQATLTPRRCQPIKHLSNGSWTDSSRPQM